MRQMYFCPQCRALIEIGDRFCSNCGTRLNWVILQTPTRTGPQSSGYPDQQGAKQQLPSGGKQAASPQQRTIPHKVSQIPQKCGSLAGGATTPISSEISRMLADFFNKQVQNN